MLNGETRVDGLDVGSMELLRFRSRSLLAIRSACTTSRSRSLCMGPVSALSSAMTWGLLMLVPPDLPCCWVRCVRLRARGASSAPPGAFIAARRPEFSCVAVPELARSSVLDDPWSGGGGPGALPEAVEAREAVTAAMLRGRLGEVSTAIAVSCRSPGSRVFVFIPFMGL